MRTLLTAVLFIGLALVGDGAKAQDRISWLNDFRQAQQIAAQRSQLVLVHFWGENCAPCVRLEHYVFNRPEVIRAINSGYVPVKVNVSERPDVADRFRITSMPVDVILSPDGREIHRSVSPQNPNQYTAQLDQVAAHYRSGLQTGMVGATASSPGSSPVGQPSNSFTPTTNSLPAARRTGSFGGLEDSRQSTEFIPSDRTRAPWTGGPNAAGQPGAAQGAALTGPAPSAVANAFTSPNPNSYPAPAANPAATQPIQNPFAGQPQAGYGERNSFVPPAAAPAAAAPHASSNSRAPHNAWGQAGAVAGSIPAGVPGGSPATADAQPVSFQLPAGTPPLLLDGCCSVSLVERSEWRAGQPQFGAVHRGRTYLFAGPAEQAKFFANPDRYRPVLTGFDPVRFVELGQVVEGRRDFGVSFNDQIYLFSDAETRDRFESNPYQYARAANEEMRRSDLSNPTTR